MTRRALARSACRPGLAAAAPPRAGQRGAALLTAMVIVVLVATLASAMVWQQWRAVQVEAAERARAQAGWMLTGMLDFGALILREDARTSAAVDNLTEPWAQPLEEARISTFLAADKNNTDDAPEAFVSGAIVDAQSKFNLTNLVSAEPAQAEKTRAQLARLCVGLDVAASTAERIAVIMNSSKNLATSAITPLEPRAVDQLGWFGLAADVMARLSPYVVILPGGSAPTALNVNTASAKVMAAVLDIPDSTAQMAVQRRANTPFKDVGDFKTVVPNVADGTPTAALLDVKSSYFLIRVRLRLDRRILEETSLVFRNAQARQVTPLNRQRDSLRELTP